MWSMCDNFIPNLFSQLEFYKLRVGFLVTFPAFLYKYIAVMCIDHILQLISVNFVAILFVLHLFRLTFVLMWTMIISQIKKFKDALAKHSPDRCSLGPTKGLEEKELLALSANKELSFTYKPKPEQPVAVPEQEEILTAPASACQGNSHPPLPLPRPLQSKTPTITVEDTKDKTLVTLGRWFRQFPCQPTTIICTVLLCCVLL